MVGAHRPAVLAVRHQVDHARGRAAHLEGLAVPFDAQDLRAVRRVRVPAPERLEHGGLGAVRRTDHRPAVPDVETGVVTIVGAEAPELLPALEREIPHVTRVAASVLALRARVPHFEAHRPLGLEDHLVRHAAPVGVCDERHPALGGDVRGGGGEIRERLVVVGLDRAPVRAVAARILGDVGDADREDLDVVVHADAGVGGELGAGDHGDVLGRRDVRERPVIGDRAHVEAHPLVVAHMGVGLELAVGPAGVGVQGGLQPDPVDVEREPVRHARCLSPRAARTVAVRGGRYRAAERARKDARALTATAG